jgi:hypothetical protein
MNRNHLKAIAVQALAVLVPFWVISWAGQRQLGIWPSAAIPFGFNRVAIVYLLAGWLLSSWLGQRCARWLPRRSSLTVMSASAVGLIVALGVLYLPAPFMASASVHWDWFTRHVIRIVAVLCLQLPWFVAAAAAADDVTTLSRPTLTDLALAILAVGLAPLLYAEYLVQLEIRIYEQARRDQQILSAWQVVRRLNAFGADNGQNDSPTGSSPLLPLVPAEAALFREVQAAVRTISTPLPAKSSASDRTRRAFVHYQLADFDTAAQILADDSLSTDPRAIMTHGLVMEHAKNPSKSVELYQRAIDLELQNHSPDSEILGRCFERLANGLRLLRRNASAEKALKEGMMRWPAGRSELTYQLGLHYRLVGRIPDAIHAFSEIATEDSRVGQLAEDSIRQIRSEPSGCMLRLPPELTSSKR